MKNTTAQELLSFIGKHPGRFHVVSGFENMLLQNGFQKLYMQNEWRLSLGGKYFITPNDSAVIAFSIPNEVSGGFMLSAAHSDAPTFKIKDGCDKVSAHYTQLNTEVYGGALLNTWFDRPLGVCGRVMVNCEGRLVSKLCNIDSDLLMIPSVAIHMNREANRGVEVKPNVDTFPLFGDESSKDKFLQLVARNVDVEVKDIVAHDLYLYNRQSPTFFGDDEQYIAAPFLDDVECAYGCMQGLINAQQKGSINLCCVFDNEEVGSGTKQGAEASTLVNLLRRIVRSLGMDEDSYLRMLPHSFMVSADNAHAMHPNHPEYSDSCNCPYMNKGIAIKFNANQRYTTDAVSAAIFRNICKAAEVPTQVYANRSDMPGGGTLGSIATTKLPINTVDIGLAQLAMHSSFETAGAEDIDSLKRAMTAFYSSQIFATEDGYTIQ